MKTDVITLHEPTEVHPFNTLPKLLSWAAFSVCTFHLLWYFWLLFNGFDDGSESFTATAGRVLLMVYCFLVGLCARW